MKKSDQLLAELNALKSRHVELQRERSAIEQRLKAVDNELKDLQPTSYYGGGWGKIRRAENDYELALMEELDKLLPSPAWVKDPSRIGEKFIIARKPTPKRIYIKRVGDPSETFYSREDGMHCKNSYYGILDVDATMAAWVKYQKEVNEASN
jgi:hypothetical protein